MDIQDKIIIFMGLIFVILFGILIGIRITTKELIPIQNINNKLYVNYKNKDYILREVKGEMVYKEIDPNISIHMRER